ncbi:MAG: hypothetical protein ACNA7O_09425 [Rhodobacterales bacterium]
MAQAAKPQTQAETPALSTQSRPTQTPAPVVAQQQTSKGAVFTDFASI